MKALTLTLIPLLSLCPLQSTAQTLHFLVTGANDAPVPQVVIAAGKRGDAHTPERLVMDQVNRQFVPYILPVHKDDLVGFPNSDQIRHHVYSFSPANSFEIKLYHGKPSDPVLFDKSGAVVLGCNIHDNMVGYIFVTDRPTYAATDETGQVELQLDSEADSIDVWHPALSLDSQKVLTFKLDELVQEGDVYHINLKINPPDEDPQAIEPENENRFRRYRRN